MQLNRYITQFRWLCLALMLVLLPSSLSAQEAVGTEAETAVEAKTEHKADGKVDVNSIVMGHLEDSYEWHITKIGEREIYLPLPVIVKGESSGWSVFSSSKLTHGGNYEGFSIAKEGRYRGKIVEYNTAGEQVRPWDFSITKTALALMVNSLILIFIILYTARWYRSRSADPTSEAGGNAPKGFRGVIEMLVESIQDGLIKPCVGEGYQKYTPFLLTAFFFILINNVMGIVPLFPGGANVTGNIAITLVLALCTFFIVNFSGTREYWKEIFWPDVPIWLKVPLPIMPVIELFGVFTKPFALTIRLFANIMAGHAVILGLTCLVFIAAPMGVGISTSMSAVSLIFGIFMGFVELLVAFIQAYVFTMLSAVFIGLAKVKPHEQKTH